MRLRNTIIALVLLVLVGGYALVVGRYSVTEPKKTVFKLKPEDIAEIELKYPDRMIALARDKKGDWQLTKPVAVEANQIAVGNLARAIAECEVKKTVEEKPVDLKPFGLDQPQVIVSVKTTKGKALPGLLVGKTTPVGFSAYIKTADKPAVLLTAAAFPPGMKKTVDQLRNRDLMTFKVPDVKTITIARDRVGTIEIDRDDGKWKIVKPKFFAADQTQVRQLLTTLAGAKVVDFVADTPASVARFGLEKPHLTVTVSNGKPDGVESLLVGFKQVEQGKSGTYVRRGERTPVYTAADYVVAAIDKSLLDLRDKTVFGFKSKDVSRIRIAGESGKFSLARQPDNKWQLDEGARKGPADSNAVERFLSRLSGLKGRSILADPMPDPVPFGMDHPSITFALDGKDGKPLGEIKLAKVVVKNPGPPLPGENPGPRTEYYATSSAGTAVYSLGDFSYKQLDKAAAEFRSNATSSPKAKKKA